MALVGNLRQWATTAPTAATDAPNDTEAGDTARNPHAFLPSPSWDINGLFQSNAF